MALRPATTRPSDDEPVGALVVRLGDDIRRIVRAEVSMVQLRVDAVASALGRAARGLVAVVVLSLGALGALVAGLVLLVATLIPLATWLAALLVGAVLLALGSIVGVAAVGALKRGVREALDPVEVEVTRRGC